MKTIVWIGPDRLIPPYGAVDKDSEVTVPDHVAESFIKQKLARPAAKVKEKSATTAGDDNG